MRYNMANYDERPPWDMMDYEQAAQNGYCLDSLREISIDQLEQIQADLETGAVVILKVTMSDYNKGRLFSTQDWIDDVKTSRASKRENKNTLPSGFLHIRTTSKGQQKICLIMVDGNHRLSERLLTENAADVRLVPGELNSAVWGFNAVFSQVKRELGYLYR
jgi:hypothetical protein